MADIYEELELDDDNTETGADPNDPDEEVHEDDEDAVASTTEDVTSGALAFDPMSILSNLVGLGVPKPRATQAKKAVVKRVKRIARRNPEVRRTVKRKMGKLVKVAQPTKTIMYQGKSVTLETIRQMINFQQLAFVNDSVAATATEAETFTIQQDGLALAMYINPAASEIVLNNITYMGYPWIILGAQSASGWIATAQHSPPIPPKELRSGANLTASVTNNAGAAVQLTWSIMGIPWQSLRADAIPDEVRAYLTQNGYDVSSRFGTL